MDHVIIVNNEARMFAVDKHTMQSEDFLRIMPGVNKIPIKKWELASKHPQVKALIDQGEIEVGESRDVNKFIKSMKPKQAVDVVRKTIDPDLLKTWHKTEARPEVKRQISIQLKRLAAPAEIRDRSKTAEEREKDSKESGDADAELAPDNTDDGEF